MEIKSVLQPHKIEEALSNLKEYKPSKVLAGGTDLVIDINKGKLEAEYIIDLGKVKELRQITESCADISIGSMITFTDIKNSKVSQESLGALRDCASAMGSPQIRNKATLGGNVINAGAAADIVPCLMLLDASLTIEHSEGKREVSCEEYFTKYNENKIQEEELLTRINISKTNGFSGFYKLGKRNSLAISRLSAAVYLEAQDNVVKSFKIALGAVGRFAFRVREIEKTIEGKKLEYLFSSEVLDALEHAVSESIKGRKTMPFKKEAVKGVYKEAVRRATERILSSECILDNSDAGIK